MKGTLVFGNPHPHTRNTLMPAASPGRSIWEGTQRVHVGIWYKAQRGSYIPTLRPKYLPYTYMDPLGNCVTKCGMIEHQVQMEME